MINVGIAGIGFMGWIHYLAYQRVRGVKLAAVFSRNKKKLAGDWRGIRLEEYSHDRNVDVLTEREPADAKFPGVNGLPSNAQFLGQLAPNEKSGDDNRRLGFEVRRPIWVS